MKHLSSLLLKITPYLAVFSLLFVLTSFTNTPHAYAQLQNTGLTQQDAQKLQNAANPGTTLNPCNNAGNVSPDFAKKLCSNTGEGSGQKVANTVQRAIVAVLIIAAVISLVFLIWGGIKWILSGGDKTKVETARNTIIAAIVGLIIAFLAYFILSIVLGIFGLSLGSLTIPSITGQ